MNSEKSFKAKRNLELNFSHDVTREQLIATLDSIIGHYGCPNCGLNGWGVTFKGDPEMSYTKFSRELINSNQAIIGINSAVNPAVNIARELTH